MSKLRAEFDPMGAQTDMSAAFASQFLPDAETEREAAAAEQRVRQEIVRLELEHNVAELDELGYTVLRPQQVAPPDFIRRLYDAILKVAGRRSGIAVNIETGETHRSLHSEFGQVQFEACLLEEDTIFEAALMNERALALITWLLGESCVLCHFSTMIKGPGVEYLPLHTDQNQNGAPAPFPPYAQVANATWALTDYTREGGATCFVPGSHKWCRHPTGAEATNLASFVPLEVTAGSIIIWHGNTWHGALPRTTPGVRVSLVEYFNRWYHLPIDGLRTRVTQAMLDRNTARFAVLTGAALPVLSDSNSARAKATRINPFA